MPTRTITGTVNNLSVNAGSEITYLGTTTAIKDTGVNIRAFRVNPSTTGDIIVKIVKSNALLTMEIFQEDSYTSGNAPSGYMKFVDIAKAGKDKGAVAVTVTNAAKDYVVLLEFDSYADFSYVGTVDVP